MLIGQVGRMLRPGLSPKNLKIVLNTSLPTTQQYKVRITDKVGQSRERSSALFYTLW